MSAKAAKELEEIIAGGGGALLAPANCGEGLEIRNAIVSAYAQKLSGKQLKFTEKELLALIRWYSWTTNLYRRGFG